MHLEPWVDLWKKDQMFAGIGGRGALDASYETAILLEWCKVHDIAYSGGTLDIYKCF